MNDYYCNHGQRVADEKADTVDIPEKGDAVVVKFTGAYSHQGGTGAKGPDKAVGFHVVEVRDRNGRLQQAHVPPEGVSIQVLEKALPPEPPVGAVVRDRVGDVWQRSGYGRGWHQPGSAWPRTWRQLQDFKPLTRLYSEPAFDTFSAADETWSAYDSYTALRRPIGIRYTGRLWIGSAGFNNDQARSLAKRILSTVGWE